MMCMRPSCKKFYSGVVLDSVLTEINGQPALIVRDGDEVLGVMAIETDGDKITTLYGLRNPDKLNRLLSSLTKTAPGSSASAAQ